MQTTIHAGVLGVSLDQVVEPIDVVKPVEARQAAPVGTEAVLFQAVTRKKAPDAAAFGLLIILYAMGLATGLWMVLDVARGLAIAERCDGKCVEVAR